MQRHRKKATSWEEKRERQKDRDIDGQR